MHRPTSSLHDCRSPYDWLHSPTTPLSSLDKVPSHLVSKKKTEVCAFLHVLMKEPQSRSFIKWEKNLAITSSGGVARGTRGPYVNHNIPSSRPSKKTMQWVHLFPQHFLIAQAG